MFLWPDIAFSWPLLWVPTQETLNKTNTVKWSKSKKNGWRTTAWWLYNLPQMSTFSKEQKKLNPTTGNLPNWVIKSVKPNLCNKDGQLVTSTCTNIIIIDSIHTKPVDMPRLWFCHPPIYPVSQRNAVHFADHFAIIVVFFLLEK